MAPANAGAARVETLRLRVRACGVGGAQGAVDGGGEVVVVQPQRHAQVGLDGAGVQGGFEVGGVAAGEGEQRVGAVDLRGLQDAFLR